MQQESAQKFVDSQRHQTLFVLVSGIAPAERDDAVGERDQSMVRDRDTMGILAEIAKGTLPAAKRTFSSKPPRGSGTADEPDGNFAILIYNHCVLYAAAPGKRPEPTV